MNAFTDTPARPATDTPARPASDTPARAVADDGERTGDEQLAALFAPEVANQYRSRWDLVQRGFVDDPRQAVRQGDELVEQVIKNLAETFANERAALDRQLEQADKASTESLRIALQRYHSLFERLLAF